MPVNVDRFGFPKYGIVDIVLFKDMEFRNELWGSLARQYYITSIHIGGLNTPKILKNILPHIKGLRGFFNLT